MGGARRARRGRRAPPSPARTSGCWCASAPAWSRAPATGNPSRGLSFLLLGKTAALFALVFVAIARACTWTPIPFALGFSVFVVSIMMLGPARDVPSKAKRKEA